MARMKFVCSLGPVHGKVGRAEWNAQKAKTQMLRLWAATCVATLAMTTAAWAVDVVNRDKIPREIVLNLPDGNYKTLTVKPQEKATGVCAECVVLYGRTSAEATGNDVVQIEGGKVSIGSKR